MRSQMVTMQNRIATLEAAKGILEVRSQPDETKTAAEPTAFHFKGLTLTPGGFLTSTALVRARNENADVATSHSAIPLDGSSNANLSELRGTARNSQLSLLLRALQATQSYGDMSKPISSEQPPRRTTCNPVPGLLA